MKKFAEEFKKFIMRGNVMDMAVGVIIGGAFGAITTSLVSNVITPLLAALFKSPNPDALNFTLRAADEAAGTEAIVLGLGTFLGTIINFLVIALALFAVIKAINKAKELAEKAKKKEEEEAKAEEPPKPTTEELLAAILEELKKKE
jgi:large conductance mechanosensitive channel